jgi:hypothetical protein
VQVTNCPAPPPKQPHLAVAPSIIDVQQTCQAPDPDSGSELDWDCTVNLSNTGNADDSWQTTAETTDPMSDTLPAGATQTLAFSLDYYCTNPSITIQGIANSVTVQVTNCPTQSSVVR